VSASETTDFTVSLPFRYQTVINGVLGARSAREASPSVLDNSPASPPNGLTGRGQVRVLSRGLLASKACLRSAEEVRHAFAIHPRPGGQQGACSLLER
jgi:hypothetical protein